MPIDPWKGYNEGMQTLGKTFDEIREEKKNAPLEALKARILGQQLAREDINLAEAQRTAADKLALRDAMANAQPTTRILPPTPAAARLAAAPQVGIVPGQQFTSPQPATMAPTPQAPASPTVQAYNEGRVVTEAPDLNAIAKKTLMSQGNYDAAAKVGELMKGAISLDDIMAKRRAEVELYGSPEAKARLDVEEARHKTAVGILKTANEADPTGQLARQAIKAHPELYPGINPDAVKVSNGITYLPFPGGYVVGTPDGKWEVKHIETEKPANITDADKFVNAKKAEYKAANGKDMPAGLESELRMEYHRALKPVTNVNITSKEQTEEAKTVGKGQGERYNDIVKAGDVGFRQKNMYGRLEQLLDGVTTGKLAPTGTQVAAVAESLGLQIDKNLSNKQAAQALSNQLALELRNPAGGAGMPGAMSDSDRKFLADSIPSLSQTVEGNKLMIQYAKATAQRAIDVSKMASAYRQKHGTLDVGFNQELQSWADANPLFADGKAVTESLYKPTPPSKQSRGVKTNSGQIVTSGGFKVTTVNP